MLTISAYAKINLSLEVVRKRPDNYHEIVSVLQTISLSDDLSFEPADELKFSINDARTDQPELLEGAVLKAANLLREEADCKAGAAIRLERMGIPRAAGLGSSSSVPAAVLKGLNELWSLGFSREELSRLAAKIGSDTPFFIYGGTALAEGRGERITPIPTPLLTGLVLLHPVIKPVPDKTAKMYGMLNPSHFSSGDSGRKMARDLQEAKPLRFDMLCNTFESVAFRFFPRLSEYQQILLDAGANRVHLAGAGPTLFTLVASKSEGEGMVQRLKDKGLNASLAHTIQ